MLTLDRNLHLFDYVDFCPFSSPADGILSCLHFGSNLFKCRFYVYVFFVFTSIVQAPKVANLADVIDPVIHLLLSFGHQVKNAWRGLHHKQVLPVEVSLYPKLRAQGFDLTLLQVDDANGLLRVLTLIILQDVRIAAHATSPEHEPAFPPCLRKRERDKHSTNMNSLLT